MSELERATIILALGFLLMGTNQLLGPNMPKTRALCFVLICLAALHTWLKP